MYQEEYKRWLAADLQDADLNPELSKIEGNDEEIKDRFAVALKFGTAGLRGVLGAGTNRIPLSGISGRMRNLFRNQDLCSQASFQSSVPRQQKLSGLQDSALLYMEGFLRSTYLQGRIPVQILQVPVGSCQEVLSHGIKVL